jgi:hypothetical protein
MIINRSGLNRTRWVSVLSALILFVGFCYMQANPPTASAQGISNSLLEIVPTTPLSSVASGGQGSFYVEAQVFLNRTVNTSNCTIDENSQQSFFNGGNLVGTLRIWGVRTGISTGNGAGVTASTQALNLTDTALTVVNMSLDLPSFNGSLEMQGTLGRTRQNFENLLSINGNPQIGNATSISIPLQDTVAITGGTGVFRGVSGEATLTPLLTVINNGTSTTNVNCSTGAFRLTLSQVRRSNVFSIP